MPKLPARFAAPFLPSLVVLALTACGSNDASGSADASASPDATASDCGCDAAAWDASEANDANDAGDHGSPSSTYPAFTVDAPQIVSNQGVVLKSPIFATISWPGDTNAPTWEAFGDGIGASAYWSGTTSEYGVGAATSGPSNHVRMAQPLPGAISYTDLDSFVLASVSAAEPDAGAPDAGGDASASDAGDAGPPNPTWPAPTVGPDGNVQTVYSLFIPSTTAVTDPGTGQPFCTEGATGYHANVMVGTQPVAYSVTLECPGGVPAMEETAAHEYVEAVTDPFPGDEGSLGYVGYDPNHLAWDLYTGFNDELADACQAWAYAYYQEAAPFPYWVQRVWSNAHASAGHDPCAPEPAGAFEGMTLFPSQESTVNVDLTSIGLSAVTTPGFLAPVGQSVTFQVGFYSDADTGGPWTIAYDFPTTTQLFDTSGNPVANGAATVTIDKTSGQNGEKANVTVTPTTAGPLGFQIMAITWDPPPASQAAMYLPHYLPLIIANK